MFISSSTPELSLGENFGRANMTNARTQMTSIDKGKILALAEIMSAEKIALEIGRNPTTV